MTVSGFHLAQANIARMRAPLDQPIMEGFKTQIDHVNMVADRSPGFVWRLQGEEGNATAIRAWDDERILFNMSVWESLEALHHYVYRSDHSGPLRDRKEWFEPMDGPVLVMWWIRAGHLPSVEEAKARFELLRRNGPTADAFTFRTSFPAPSMFESEQLVVRDTKPEELERICEMEQGEARNFIIPYSPDRHQSEFVRPGTIYKSILRDEQHIGFLILVLDADGRSVEFRRIVVVEPGHGYGKRVVGMIDEICRQQLQRTRLWLDVFETNERAQHVYEQCGYRRFGKSEHEGRTLLLYEKEV